MEAGLDAWSRVRGWGPCPHRSPHPLLTQTLKPSGTASHLEMDNKKRLAYAIIQFLHDQLRHGGLSSDAQESLEGTRPPPAPPAPGATPSPTAAEASSPPGPGSRWGGCSARGARGWGPPGATPRGGRREGAGGQCPCSSLAHSREQLASRAHARGPHLRAEAGAPGCQAAGAYREEAALGSCGPLPGVRGRGLGWPSRPCQRESAQEAVGPALGRAEPQPGEEAGLGAQEGRLDTPTLRTRLAVGPEDWSWAPASSSWFLPGPLEFHGGLGTSHVGPPPRLGDLSIVTPQRALRSAT